MALSRKKIKRYNSSFSISRTLNLVILLILSISVFVTVIFIQQNQRLKQQAQTIPSPLPDFGLGVYAGPDSNGINGWMPDSGVPWNYSYLYLSGGVNTGSGWETWNSNGQYALSYAINASSKGYIPIFSYYEIYQSNGDCNTCAEDKKGILNLNNTLTMNSYYKNFILLMKRLGGTYDGVVGFGKTAIVHIEPDLSGYAMQAVLNNLGRCFGYCTAQGMNPSYLKTSVASSGVEEVASFPDTFAGFNQALIHIRNLYAPKVLLAFHVSSWGAGSDVATSIQTGLNALDLGNNAGSFVNQSGNFDLIFNDVSDRDASYYKYVLSSSKYWWDRSNNTFPNFKRWEEFIKGIYQTTGKPIIAWQIPEGNQYFRTVNNTNGHYQDNRAEYFFSHIQELKDVGIAGLLFGAPLSSNTSHTDRKKDGITNPASICNSDGSSTGQICNNNTSIYPDDDGGFIRIQAQNFYKERSSTSPTLIPSPTPTPTVIVSTPTPTPTQIPASTPTPSSTIDTVPPTVSITYPANGSKVKARSSIYIQANASDNVKVNFVRIFVNSSFVCNAYATPYSCYWRIPNGSGIRYDISAQAYDSKGNLGLSSSIYVTSIK